MTYCKRASALVVAALVLGAFAVLVVGEFEFIGVLAPLPPPGTVTRPILGRLLLLRLRQHQPFIDTALPPRTLAA